MSQSRKLVDLVGSSLEGESTLEKIRNSLPVNEAKILEHLISMLNEYDVTLTTMCDAEKQKLHNVIVSLVRFFTDPLILQWIDGLIDELETRN